MGQLLSTRADLLPPPYLAALSRLQDRCASFPAEEVRQIIAEELGADVGSLFTAFDDTPLAAASLGQVHQAVLRSGRLVAVKVQRPGIESQVITDLEALGELAGLVDRRSDIDGASLAEDLFEAYLHQVLLNGFFHADPHPGNVFITDDGRLALLDLGMVAQVPPSMQEHMVRLLVALSEGDGSAVATHVVALGERLHSASMRWRAGWRRISTRTR